MIPLVASSITEDTGRKAGLEQELKDSQQARSDAKATMATTTAIREKEAAAFAAADAEYKGNIAALEGAISSISKDMFGGFLQTEAAASVRKLALAGPAMSDMARRELLAFLSADQGEGYVPQSGEIVGILNQLKDEMVGTLAGLTNDEKAAIGTYNDLIASKTKEVAALTAAIEAKSKRVGELGVNIALKENDVEDTREALAADQKFLGDLKKDCGSKTAEYEENKQTRSVELTALADTIKVLNDDAALELFKKTLPSASLLQVQMRTDTVRHRALAVLSKVQREAKSIRPQLDMLALALHGKQVGFGKVIAMIDNMIVLLKKEQVEDDAKKENCATQFDSADDAKKGLEQKISSHESSMEEADEGIIALKAELKALEDGIEALDKSVAEATEQRKKEHAEHTELMANDSAAKDLINWAKNRLNKLYNKGLFKPAPKRSLDEEERITVNLGGTLAPTQPPAGIAGTGISAFAQATTHVQSKEAPPPAPETYGAYTNQESSGVIAMMDLLIKDLDKEMQVAKVQENDAQAEYEEMVQENDAQAEYEE